MKTPSRRTLIVVALAGVLLLGAVAIAVAFAVRVHPEPSPTAAVGTPTPTPSPTPTATTLPVSAPVSGALDWWATPSPLTIAQVIPQVGDAAEGAVAAYVDAPVVDAEVAVLTTDIVVQPGTEYEVSLKARVGTLEMVDVPAAVTVGSERIALPELDALWHEVDGTFTAKSATEHLAIVLTGPVAALGIDDIVVREAGDASAPNVVTNPSFEQVTTSARIVNRSLVLPAGRAVLAVSGAEGAATWAISDAAGQGVAGGTATLAGPVTAIALDGVDQGYYTASVVDAAGTETATPIAVLDMPSGSIPLDTRFGVGLHVENDYYADAASLAASLGIGAARNDILWARNETTPGVYDFQSYYTDGFASLHSHGIHLLGIVNYGNKLYGDKNVPSNAEALAAYGRYAAAIAERFDLIGLEVFNEFNHDRFNKAGCGTDPSCYVPLLQTVHDAVRAVDPTLPLVAGSTANYDGAWFDGLWRAGGLALSDAVSYHPYQIMTDAEQLWGIVAESIQHMQEIAGTTKPVWITELGMPSTPAMLTLDEQANFAMRATLTALAAGAERYFWYDLINDSPDPTVHEGNFGLFYQARDGVAALAPKPSAFAYGLLISQLSGLVQTGNDVTDAGVISVAFVADDGRSVHAAWAPGGGQVQLATADTAEVVASDGSTTQVPPVDGVVTVPLGAAPVFIHLAASTAATPTPSSSPSPSPSSSPSGTPTR